MMKYIKKILDNGLTVIMLPDKKSKFVSTGFFVNVGSRNEPDNMHGIAHFLEHMVFKGTTERKASEIFLQLDKQGINYNAATAHQYTYYYLSGLSHNIKSLLDIMLDLFVNPSLPKNEIDKERKVIIEEMRMSGDSPNSKLFKLMHEKLFSETSLQHSIIGTESSINSIGKKDFNEFRKNLYMPNKTVFCIEGNFNHDLIFKTIEKILGPIENNKTAEKFTYESDANIISARFNSQSHPVIHTKIDNNLDQAYVMIVYPLIESNMYKQHAIEIDMLSHLLTNGFSSRLGKKLREEHGLTYNIDAGPMIYNDAGTFNISMVIHPDQLIFGIKLILKELKKLTKEEITTDELTKLKNIMQNEYTISNLQGLDKLKYFGLNFVADRNFKPDEETDIQKIKQIKKSQIKNISAKIFQKNKLNLFIYGNIKFDGNDFTHLS